MMVWWQDHEKLLKVCDAMDRWGGKFHQHIAAAYREADKINQQKLAISFFSDFEEFDRMRVEHGDD